MGDLHNELRRGPLSRAVTRALGMQVGAVGLERLDESLSVVLDLWNRPEMDYLQKKDRYQFGALTGVNAGTVSYVQLRIPAGSNIIAVVEKVIFSDSAAANAYFIGLSTPNASGTPGSIMDSRRDRGLLVGTGAVSVGLVSARTDQVGDGVGMAVNPLRIRVPGNTITVVELPYVLVAGEALSIINGAVNTAVNASLIWTERAALPGELD